MHMSGIELPVLIDEDIVLSVTVFTTRCVQGAMKIQKRSFILQYSTAIKRVRS